MPTNETTEEWFARLPAEVAKVVRQFPQSLRFLTKEGKPCRVIGYQWGHSEFPELTEVDCVTLLLAAGDLEDPGSPDYVVIRDVSPVEFAEWNSEGDLS